MFVAVLWVIRNEKTNITAGNRYELDIVGKLYAREGKKSPDCHVVICIMIFFEDNIGMSSTVPLMVCCYENNKNHL